jgi:3-dehydroquinate dehydratase II
MAQPKILVIQGANMNWLGKREPEKYGTTTAAELDAMLRDHAAKNGYGLEIFYTNHEGACIDRIYQAVGEGVDALVMNPGGFTYAGRAIGDCIRATRIPYVEVHIKNHYASGGSHSVIADAANGVIVGFGVHGYPLALDAALRIARERASAK